MQSACFCSKRIDVEALLQDRDPVRTALGRDAEVAHPGQERVFVAEEPDAQRMAAEVLGLPDAGVFAAGQHHAGAIEDLGDVDQLHAALARRQRRRHPLDDHVGPAARDHLRRGDVGAARQDRDVEVGLLVVALLEGDVVAGELRLGDPLQLQRQLVGRLGRGRTQGQGRRNKGACRCPHDAFPPASHPAVMAQARGRVIVVRSGRTDARRSRRARAAPGDHRTASR